MVALILFRSRAEGLLISNNLLYYTALLVQWEYLTGFNLDGSHSGVQVSALSAPPSSPDDKMERVVSGHKTCAKSNMLIGQSAVVTSNGSR